MSSPPPRVPSRQLARARAMRRDMTGAEEVSGAVVATEALAPSSARQVAIGPFIVDFASIAAKVVVEVDGPSHDAFEQGAYDQRRDAWLRSRGWRVVRLRNDLVIGGGQIALDQVRDVIAVPPPSYPPP